MREGHKTATIPAMMNEHETQSSDQKPPEEALPKGETTDEPLTDNDSLDTQSEASVSSAAEPTTPLENTAEIDSETLVEDESESASQFESAMPLDELDIDAALAAVSSLSDVIAEQVAAEEARLAAQAAAEQAAAERQARLEHPELFFSLPTPVVLKRGHPASVIPGVLLIAVGSWLTFVLTTSSTPPDNGLIIAIAIGSVALALLAHWLGSGRWARGAFFMGITLLALAGGILVLVQPGTPDLAAGWPLLVIAPGLALLLAAFLTRPAEKRLILPGLILTLSGVMAFALLAGLLGEQIASFIRALWPAAVAILVILLLLPLIVRRRNAARS